MNLSQKRKMNHVLIPSLLSLSLLVGCTVDMQDKQNQNREERISQRSDCVASGISRLDSISSYMTSAGGIRTMNYLGNSANDDDHHGLYNETQGIANGDPTIGDNYWYFSKNFESTRNTNIYRVNYSQHLAHNFAYDKRLIQMPGGSKTCEHVGDIDYHIHKGIGYIVAGYDHCGDKKGRIAFFKASSINGSSVVLDPISVLLVDAKQDSEAPWVAVRNDGRIYSSHGGTNLTDRIFEYEIYWDEVAAQTPIITAKDSRTIFLKEQDGTSVDLDHRQGADFSTDSSVFYILNGAAGESSTHNIRVFEVTSYSTWYQVDKSSRSSMPFKYETHNSDEEPEGISFFDANKIVNYHPSMPKGELHAILLNNDAGDDNVWIKHYTRICNNGGVYTPIGDGSYCIKCGLCASGEGDCDNDSECQSSRKCVANVGLEYGWDSWVDVCELPVGHMDYCKIHGPCLSGEGDCDHNRECKEDLICASDVGADYGFESWVDVCIDCQRNCNNRECGSDGCSGSCGSCGANETCNNGQCVCQPSCSNRECGSDGCGGSCGSCNAGEVCISSQCQNNNCGNIGNPCSSNSDCCFVFVCVRGACHAY